MFIHDRVIRETIAKKRAFLLQYAVNLLQSKMTIIEIKVLEANDINNNIKKSITVGQLRE